MKSIYISIIMLSVSVMVFSQEVVSSAGDTHKSTNVEISWTIGEPVIETVVSGENILTQGFHQSKLTVTPVFSIMENNNITAYPNPTSDVVFVKFTGDLLQGSKAELYSLDGKLLKIEELNSDINPFDVKALPNGEYILSVTQGSQQLRSFKLVKTF